MRNFPIFTGHIILQYLNPMPTAGLTMDDLPSLMNRVHELMQTEYEKISKEVLDALPPGYPLPTFLTTRIQYYIYKFKTFASTSNLYEEQMHIYVHSQLCTY